MLGYIITKVKKMQMLKFCSKIVNILRKKNNHVFYTNQVKNRWFVLIFLDICANILNNIKFIYKGGRSANE